MNEWVPIPKALARRILIHDVQIEVITLNTGCRSTGRDTVPSITNSTDWRSTRWAASRLLTFVALTLLVVSVIDRLGGCESENQYPHRSCCRVRDSRADAAYYRSSTQSVRIDECRGPSRGVAIYLLVLRNEQTMW